MVYAPNDGRLARLSSRKETFHACDGIQSRKVPYVLMNITKEATVLYDLHRPISTVFTLH